MPETDGLHPCKSWAKTSWSPWAGTRPAAPSAGVHTQPALCHHALPPLALLPRPPLCVCVQSHPTFTPGKGPGDLGCSRQAPAHRDWDWEGKTISERELELGSDSVLVGHSVSPSSGGQLPGQGVGGDPRKVFCHRGCPGRGQGLESVGVRGSGSHWKEQNLQHMVGGGGGIWSGKGIQVCITGASSAELGD